MANHEEYLFAYSESTHRLCIQACNQWMNAKLHHPLYQELSATRTTLEDKRLLNIIHEDIHELRQHFLKLLHHHKEALQDYDDFQNVL